MKRKTLGLAAFALTAALSLSVCGGAANAFGVSISGKNIGAACPALWANTTERPALREDATETPALQAEKLDVDVSASANAFEDAFSSRDLSGTWDADSAVLIALNGDAVSCDSDAVTVSGSVATITAAGTYRVTGALTNGSLIVDAGKEDKVQIALDNASVHSDTFAAIYVKRADKVFLTLADGTVNTLSNGGAFEAVDENNVDGAVFSKDDLTLNGSGKLVVNSPAKHGVVCKDDLTVTGGTYEITAGSHALSAKDSVAIADGAFTLKAGKDGVHAENDEDSAKGNIYLAGGTLNIAANDDGVTASGVLQMDGGALTVTAAEGLEANYIRVNDGVIRVQASDDGINAARKSGAHTPTVEINGGDISVTVGPGDTDCIDVNGNLIITGGTVSVTGNSGFDVDGSVTFTGGTVMVNGQRVTSIPNQMGMGGRGGFGGFGGADGRNRPFADAQTGATPKGDSAENHAGAANRPDETQEGVTRRNGKGGRRQGIRPERGGKTVQPENPATESRGQGKKSGKSAATVTETASAFV